MRSVTNPGLDASDFAMSSQNDPLAPLAERALASDRDALEMLCRQLQGPLYRFALRVLGTPADASDATQEILLQVITHLSQFRGESRLLTWAYSIASRHLLRSRRELSRERSMEALESRIQQGLGLTESTSAPEGDARLLERETRLGCTTAMLSCLSLEERLALVLAEMLGADDELGARLCDVTPPAYRKRLSRARQKLRPILEDLCGLARTDAPCSCARQARAKQLAGLASSTSTVPLRAVAVEDAQHAMDGLGALRQLGPVFALDSLADPPEDLWAELRRRLPAVLGAAAP